MEIKTGDVIEITGKAREFYRQTGGGFEINAFLPHNAYRVKEVHKNYLLLENDVGLPIRLVEHCRIVE